MESGATHQSIHSSSQSLPRVQMRLYLLYRFFFYLVNTAFFFIITFTFVRFLQTIWAYYRPTSNTGIINFITSPMLTTSHSRKYLLWWMLYLWHLIVGYFWIESFHTSPNVTCTKTKIRSIWYRTRPSRASVNYAYLLSKPTFHGLKLILSLTSILMHVTKSDSHRDPRIRLENHYAIYSFQIFYINQLSSKFSTYGSISR